MSNQLHLLVRYRLDEAQETLREAELLLRSTAFRGSINRSYYAMFYALLGLLATRGLGTSKHSGVMSLFDREFVKTGIFAKEFSRSLHRAFDERQVNDHGEMLKPDQKLASALLEQARVFVHEVSDYLTRTGFDL
ncbi:HEPN domain-containing protein [Synechococcus sp. PCC 7335]|uniref:HEPN domain-containing protein n=1 Tax=Synechococcus sp. (strain ATCC 29403 / PCC 7335) TaxID=91464 RepID=UPI0002FD85B8|nr:HEPN domain-containing protein [Synechococcus sp. PCC 7335]